MKRLMAGVGIALLMLLVAQPQAAGAREPDRTCGIEPGKGSFNYVETWNMSCNRAFEISRHANRKFCGNEGQRCNAPDGEFDSGKVRLGPWRCKLRVGYESYRARCFKGSDHDPRFVHRSGS